jgi:NAD-dependent dihydropyrimidine dehydrogenase PreA subunit
MNVWCAAAGGHFTDHDVIAALHVSGLEGRIAHRTLILPQLAATGIQPFKIEQATGCESRWGPARLEDVTAFLDHGCKVTREQRKMRFPLWERLEMALMWAVPMSAIALAAGWLIAGARVGWLTSGIVLAQVLSIFIALPRLPLVGAKRWWTYGGAVLFGATLGMLLIVLSESAGWVGAMTLFGLDVLAMGILSLDLAGTTPWYPGTINSLGNQFHLELVNERCTGAASCVQVCPCDVLAMNGARRKVEVRKLDACICCGACIVQCPEDALRFRFDDGRVVHPATVRATRVNMLGRRST